MLGFQVETVFLVVSSQYIKEARLCIFGVDLLRGEITGDGGQNLCLCHYLHVFFVFVCI